MKPIFSVIFVASLLAVPTITKAAVVIDGTADADYQSAIITQALGTSTFKNTETNVDAANGSELDAAYGFVSNGVLYLTLAGNMDSGGVDSSGNPFDKLSIFFMTGPGGDHVLGTNYNGNADFGHINNMGINGGPQMNGDPGLTFDTGFAANYWIGVTVGGAGVGPTMYLNREVICSGCDGSFLGSVLPSNAPPANIFVDPVFGVQAALNNSNTNGVQFDTSGCEVNGAPFNPQNVRTGVELAIPLSAIGSPTGQVSFCAFITDDQYSSMYNQALGPIWDGTPTFCQGSFGDASAVDFSALPGTHHFTFTVPPCNAFQLTPVSAAFGSSGGASNVSVVDFGSCPWNATANVPWITITSGASGSGLGTVTYAVASNNTVDVRTGSLIVSGQFATASVTITEDGKVLPPLSSIIVDGIAEPAYGCPLAVQIQGTGFGNSVGTNLMSNSGGSELDAAYGLIKDGVLFLTFAGNLENNNNRLDIFFSTGAPGQNTLTNLNPRTNSNNTNSLWDSNNGLAAMGSTTNGAGAPGLTFDPGFNANYIISVNGGGTPYKLFANYAQLWPGGTNSSGLATNAYFLGSTGTTNGTLASGTNGINPFLIQATINDSNTNGVDGSSCITNGAGALQSIAASAVRSGIELAIPLGALGNPTGPIAVCAFVNNQGHNFMSNQILGPIGATTNACFGQSNFGNPNVVNFGNFPGQHYFLVGPEVRITSITVSNSNANVVYLTEATTNLLYRVERTTGSIQTNSVWTPISAFTPGTGSTITQADNSVTSKTNVFYRVRQTPNCQ